MSSFSKLKTSIEKAMKKRGKEIGTTVQKNFERRLLEESSKKALQS